MLGLGKTLAKADKAIDANDSIRVKTIIVASILFLLVVAVFIVKFLDIFLFSPFIYLRRILYSSVKYKKLWCLVLCRMTECSFQVRSLLIFGSVFSFGSFS